MKTIISMYIKTLLIIYSNDRKFDVWSSPFPVKRPVVGIED